MIEKPGRRFKIQPPSVYLYGNGTKSMRDPVVSCIRSKTVISGIDIRNGSGQIAAANIAIGRCMNVTIEDSSSEEAGSASQQYGILIGGCASVDVFSQTGGGNRRDLDAQRCSDINVFGGNFPCGLGGHFVARMKIFGANIGCQNNITSNAIQVSGGDILVSCCNIALNDPGNNVFNVREDAWEMFGAVTFLGNTIDIDISQMPGPTKIFDLRGGATAVNPQRDISFPDLISMDESNRINVIGTNPSGYNNITLIELFNNINKDAFPFKINVTGKVVLAPTIKFEDNKYMNSDGSPRVRAIIVKPSQQIGLGYDFEFRNLPGIVCQVNAASKDGVNTIARHNFRFERCDQKGVTTSRFKYGAGAYRDAYFIECPGAFEQLNLTPAADWLPIGDEDRYVSTGFEREERVIFTSSGSWTKPDWAKTIDFVLHGAGGGGGSGAVGAGSSSRTAGSGGGAGALNRDTIDTANCPAVVGVRVGTPGAGGAAVSTAGTAGNNGSAGDYSQVSGVINGVNTLLLRANGGGGGLGGTGSALLAGGTGGGGATMEPVGDGGGANPGLGTPPTSSLRGAGGGGPGGGVGTSNNPAGGRGGGAGYTVSPTRAAPGGALGAPGTANTAGAPGANGTNKKWDYGAGSGGGGGGAGPNDGSANGGKGGDGGFPAGGGGGGGAATNSAASGAGGAGARGEVWITCRN